MPASAARKKLRSRSVGLNQKRWRASIGAAARDGGAVGAARATLRVWIEVARDLADGSRRCAPR